MSNIYSVVLSDKKTLKTRQSLDNENNLNEEKVVKVWNCNDDSELPDQW